MSLAIQRPANSGGSSTESGHSMLGETVLNDTALRQDTRPARWLGWVLGLVMAALCTALALILMSGADVSRRNSEALVKLEQLWGDEQVERQRLARAVEELFQAAGYGGLIHDFKNYVLRGDTSYRAAVVDAHDRATAAIAELNILLPEAAPELAVLADTLDQYRAMLPIVDQGVAEGWPVTRIDEAVVVNDRPAIRANAALIQAYHAGMADRQSRTRELLQAKRAAALAGDRLMPISSAVALAIVALVALLVWRLWWATLHLRGSLARVRALAESQRQLTRVVEESPAFVALVEPSGKVRYVNAAFERLTGWSREEAVGRSLRDLIRDDLGNDTRATLLRGALNEGSAPFRARCLTRQGQPYWVDGLLNVVSSGAGKGPLLCLAGQDATHLQEVQKKIRDAQKMEAVGVMASGIAHDFNNLLTAILGASHLAQMDLEPGSDAAQEVSRIETGARRASVLVQNLLGFSRRVPAAPRLHDARDIAAEVHGLFAASVPRSVQVDLDLPEAPMPVLVDDTMLHQSLFNICRNAADALPQSSGSVRIAVSSEPGEQGAQVRFRIVDTGVGMPPDVRARVFEPFFSTKPLGKGTGLGLAMSRQNVEELGGRISICSEVGSGTTVDILLPQAAGSAPADDPAAQARAHRGKPLRIVVIEDELDVLSIMRRTLQRAGHEVEGFTDPVAALQRLRTGGFVPEIVITDLVMPDLSGEQVIAEVQQILPQARILVCSQYTGRGKQLCQNGIGLLAKPFDSADLVLGVETLSQKEET